MTVCMQTTFCGISFQNPVSTASGTYGFGIEYGEFLPVERLGSITSKGLTLAPRGGNPGRRLAETPSGMLNSIGLENPGVDLFINDYLPKMRARLGDCRIIANFSGNTIEEYGRMSAILADVPEVAMYEVNISCPNVQAGGMTFGVDCDSAAAVCAAVKKETDKPVVMKLSPNVTDITAIAKACEQAGADGLSLINTLMGMKIDLKTQKPALGNITGGLSGAAVRPVGVRMVWQVSQAVHIPVMGMGGITNWEDAVEYMLAGAQMISVGAACFKDPYAPFKVIDGIAAYCEMHGIENVNDLVGGAWK